MGYIDDLISFQHSSGENNIVGPRSLEQISNGLTGINSIERGTGAYSDFSRFEEVAMQNSNLFSSRELNENRFSKFSRTNILDIWDSSGVRVYNFFTKPDLHIFDKNGVLNPVLEESSDFFPDAVETHRKSLECLQQTYVTPNNAYNYLLSNYVSNNIDFPGITSEVTMGNQNLYGINTFYQDCSKVQEYGFDFTVEFTDTAFLDTYKFFKAYQEYKNLQYEVDILPVKPSYLFNSNRYKSFSVYKIITDEVGQIKFWGKHTGIEPTSCPTDTIDSMDNSGDIRFTVNFKAFHSITEKPWILNEINLLSQRAGFSGDIIPDYDKSISAASKEWAAVPIIVESTKLGRKVYLLKWGRI